jgi:thiol-disulfide isomerase/thioredoxin
LTLNHTMEAHMPSRPILALALLLALALPASAAAQSGSVHPPTATTAADSAALPEVGNAPLSAAAAQVLRLLDLLVPDEAVELSARLVREHPDDAALHAMQVLSLRDNWDWTDAVRLSEQCVARWPDDAWVQVAHGSVIAWHYARADEALGAAARARQLAPGDARITPYVMSIYSAMSMRDEAVALADSFIDSGRGTAELRLARYTELATMAERPGRRDTAMAALAEQELRRVLEEMPPSAAVFHSAGAKALQGGRRADALPLLERAVELSPRSGRIRQTYWRGLSARPDATAAEKGAAIDADIAVWLETRQHAAAARLTVAQHFRSARDYERVSAVLDQIRQEQPGTRAAAEAAWMQAELLRYTGLEGATTQPDSTAVLRQYREDIRSILTLPGASSSVLGGAYVSYFRILEQDSTSSAEELLAVFERVQEHTYSNPPLSLRHVTLPVALAERGRHLDYAEELARSGLAGREDAIESFRDYIDVAMYAEWLDEIRSSHHSAIGWVLFHRGEMAEAKRELEKAHEILETAAHPPFRLGRIAEAEGDLEAAEIWYATVLDPRSQTELQRLYLARNESMDGFDDYMAGINDRYVARRRALIESQRIAEPEPLPPFEHQWMNGGRFDSAALQGKVAVVYFWGVWCGACVASAPRTQAFAEKFRDHPDVVFITIANDADPNTTRDFMRERGYDFPVMLDEGLVHTAGINVFPTTLFVDRDGRILFNYSSSGPRLVDEYTWRVEALLGQSVADARVAPAASHDPTGQPAAQTVPGVSASISAAAAQLLQLLYLRVADKAVELGARLVREHPDDAALHALYAISLGEHHGRIQALQLSGEQVARWPHEPWVQLARGVLIGDLAYAGEALAAAERARQLAPEDLEIARYVMRIFSWHGAAHRAVALADSLIASGRATAGLRVEKAAALWEISRIPSRPDTAAAALALRELQAALMETPPSADAYRAAGERYLWDRRPAEALAVLARAVELSPYSAEIRREYWRAITAQTEMTADQRRAMIEADMHAWLELRQHGVDARLALAEHYIRFSTRDMERFHFMATLIREEHPGTWQAAYLAYRTAQAEAWDYLDDVDLAGTGREGPTAAERQAAEQRARDALRGIASMPGVTSGILEAVYQNLFDVLARDSTAPADELLAAFARSEELSSGPAWRGSSPHRAKRRHVTLPVALAERGSHLDYAEELARAGLGPMEDALERWGRVHLSVAEYAEELDRVRSDHHAAIGWVLFQRGDVAGAKQELEQAHQARITAPTPPYRLGRIAEAEGDLQTAERWYATGRGLENWSRNSSDALRRLYLARNTTLDGFDDYLAAIDERDMARRRARVDADRIAEPEPLPAFEHAWMNGGRFSSESLKGKVAVINFWGVWCGPCVREAPEIQKFAEKFRNHPEVVFITVANDVNLDTTRDFMEERGYDFPVIFDEGLVRMAGINAFPTTLFVDREGRITFSYKGASLRLVDEFTWRVEALLGSAVASTRPAPGGL